MKKLLLISLIIGTTLSQVQHERNRIARLRRRQQLANLSERELTDGGFLPSRSARVSDGFRGSEPSFDELSGRRRRFQSNVVIRNADSPVPRRRSYLQSLRSNLRRNGGRSGRLRGSFWNTDRPVDEQNSRRTYMPAIKRPRFTPNIRDILPRRRPSYSPTARGIDSIWTPRLPTTVSAAGNVLPSNMNDFIERTNPVNDRSYISPKRPSLIVEPIPLPPLDDPHHSPVKGPTPSQTHKTVYVAPKDTELPVNSKPGYVEPMDQVLPVKHNPDYVEPTDPVLPVKHKPGYVEPTDPVLPLKHKQDYVEPTDAVLPVKHKPDYVEPTDPVLPVNLKPDYGVPTDLDSSILPGVIGHNVLPSPSLPKIPFDAIDPLIIPPVSTPGKNPGYVPNSADPSGSLVASRLETLPILPNIPDVKDPNYAVEAGLNEPLVPLDLPNLPSDTNDPGYVDPTLSSDPMGPFNFPIIPELPTNVKDKNNIADKVNSPLGPKDPTILPSDINEPGYVEPAKSVSGPLDLPTLPLDINDPGYVAPAKSVSGPLDLPTLPLDINDPGYVDPAQSASGPLDLPTLPLDINDPGYVDPAQSASGPLDLPTLPLDINDPGYVDPAQSASGPLDPITLPLDINDPGYVDPAQSASGPLDLPTLPLDINDPGYVDPAQSASGPLDLPTLPLDINDPGYVDPAQSDVFGPLTDIKDPNYVADQAPTDVKVPSNTDPNYIGSEKEGPLDAPLDITWLPFPALPNSPVGVKDPNYVEPPVTGIVDPLDQLPFGTFGASEMGLDQLPIDHMNPLGPLTPFGALDSSAALPTNKPGYIPPIQPAVDSVGSIGNHPDPRFPDTLPISTDALREPVLPIGGVMDAPLVPLASSGDPKADVNANLPKRKTPVGPISDAFGPLDLPQDPIGFRGPIPQFPQDNTSPTEGGQQLPLGVPSLPGLLDQLNTDFGGNGGPANQLPNPSDYPPEPFLPHSPLFDSNIPPIPDINGLNSDPSLPDLNGQPFDPSIPDLNGLPFDPSIPDINGLPSDQPIPDINGLPLDPSIPDINGPPLDPPSPGQLMTRSEINEAARREYARSEGAFDPKWNNPNVRNSNLYVNARPVNPQDTRPARIKTLFDFTAGTNGADFINKAVDKVSEKTKNIMTAKSKRREGYLSKYDALRSYEG